MNRLLLFGSAVLVFTLTASAQTWGRNPYDSPRDDYQQRAYRSGDFLVRRVLADLDRAAAGARLDGHEAKHFDEAARKLQDFEARWNRGRFDKGKLDSAIHNLEHLAEADRVRWRDRSMLARDVEDLRQFRASRGEYPDDGYRDYRYNDRDWR